MKCQSCLWLLKMIIPPAINKEWDFIQVVMSGRRVNVLLSKIVVSFGFSSAYCSSHSLYPFLLQKKHQQNLDWINPCKSVITES